MATSIFSFFFSSIYICLLKGDNKDEFDEVRLRVIVGCVGNGESANLIVINLKKKKKKRSGEHVDF